MDQELLKNSLTSQRKNEFITDAMEGKWVETSLTTSVFQKWLQIGLGDGKTSQCG